VLILAVNGSARKDKGFTNIVLDRFLAGAAAAGADCETIYPAALDIKPCKSCWLCWFKTPGQCVQDDDMADVLERMRAADAIVLATPVYIDHMTAQLKTMLDRMIPLMDFDFEPDENGQWRHPVRDGFSPRLVLISVSGFPEAETFDPLKAWFKRFARNFHGRISGEICFPGTLLLQQDAAPAAKHLELTERAGREFFVHKKIDAETLSALEADYVTPEDFERALDRFRRAARAKLDRLGVK
jgi:hypothetical protein